MRSLAFVLLACSTLGNLALCQTLRVADAYPGKSRYAPGDPIAIRIETKGVPTGKEQLKASLLDLGRVVGKCSTIQVGKNASSQLALTCSAPVEDFRGYLAVVSLQLPDGTVLDERETAVDVSSSWARFPRYGYLAHYNRAEGADPAKWIAELNKFHIDGLQFYDFQYRHDQPLAGTPQNPDAKWNDIAGREIDRDIVEGFIQQAHEHNMMAMAYNASYSAYDDVFGRNGNPLPLQWATWDTATEPRTPQTVKSLVLHADRWSTSKLFYMNPNDPGWQNYLFGKMGDLFKAYRFDGWHIDTFGDKRAFSFNGAPTDFVAGFRGYIDNAHAALHKAVTFNTVNTFGQERVANSNAEFVYSELWEDHETFASIQDTAEQVRLANPRKAFIIAAYVHRQESKEDSRPKTGQFNMPSVLLTDAAIFASGAGHIELGDGDRMLSNEYFPADTRLTVSAELRQALRHYYDFLTAYEFYLRDGVEPANVDVRIEGTPTDMFAVPNSVWSITRRKGGTTTIHLINLVGSSDPDWRDVSLSRPDAPHLRNLKVTVGAARPIQSLGWASPDVEGGRFHALPFEASQEHGENFITFTLPDLQYWTTLFLSDDPR